jgi:hypothetical protein
MVMRFYSVRNSVASTFYTLKLACSQLATDEVVFETLRPNFKRPLTKNVAIEAAKH